VRKLLSFLFSFLYLGIVDDSGAGGDDIDDIGDFDIGDDEDVTPPDETPQTPPDNKEGESIINSEIEELKAFKSQMEAERATNEAVASLVQKYPDFDANKVAEYLGTIAKEHGDDKAESLNNPLGWENIYLTQFKKEPSSSDPFDRGRGETKEPFDFKKGFEKAYSGDKDSVAKLLENSKG